MKRIASTILVAISTLALYAGDCSDGIDLSQMAEIDEGVIGGIQTNLTDPVAVIDAYDRCWQEQNYAAYEALLDDAFQFEPLAEDADDFPWLEGDSWEKSVELGMASNMFDDNYTQGNGAVDLIEMDLNPTTPPLTLDDGTIRVITTQIGRVMWTASDGASFDTRVEFDLVPRDGFLRIRRIEEIPRNLARGSSAGVEAASWGSVKNLYR